MCMTKVEEVENTAVDMSIEELRRENDALKATNLKLQNEVKLLHAIFDGLSEVEALQDVKGIGEKTLEKVRPFVDAK